MPRGHFILEQPVFSYLVLTCVNDDITSRTLLAMMLFTDGSAGTLDADLYTFKIVSASDESMHDAHRSKRVDRPGRTKARISRRTAPLQINLLHFRQDARPVGARDIR